MERACTFRPWQTDGDATGSRVQGVGRLLRRYRLSQTKRGGMHDKVVDALVRRAMETRRLAEDTSVLEKYYKARYSMAERRSQTPTQLPASLARSHSPTASGLNRMLSSVTMRRRDASRRDARVPSRDHSAVSVASAASASQTATLNPPPEATNAPSNGRLRRSFESVVEGMAGEAGSRPKPPEIRAVEAFNDAVAFSKASAVCSANGQHR